MTCALARAVTPRLIQSGSPQYQMIKPGRQPDPDN
jgi:hypothetical protein